MSLNKTELRKVILSEISTVTKKQVLYRLDYSIEEAEVASASTVYKFFETVKESFKDSNESEFDKQSFEEIAKTSEYYNIADGHALTEYLWEQLTYF